jgi:DNA polymerase elongation subunit (family B)
MLPGPDCGFIVDWFQYDATPNEVHALAVQLDESTGLYKKCLVRVDFQDFAFILFAQEPEAALIDRARKAIMAPDIGGTIRFSKVKTIAGYQAEPSVPSLMIRAPNLTAVFKLPAVKALGGYIEEHTAISRSRKLTALRSMAQCCWIPLAGMQILNEGDPAKISKNTIKEYRLGSWDKLEAIPLDSRESFTPPPSSALRVLSFDIEVFKPSQRGGGMPDPDDRANFVLCISSVVHEKSVLGGERREITLHTVYDVAKPEKYVPDGTVIRRYATEYEMIRGFWEQVAHDDPVLILGFNVQSWDFRYLNSRMKIHGITYPSALSIYERPAERIGMRRAHWSSDAFKNNDLLWPDIAGTIVLDLHKFYTRSRPALKKHSLDYISRQYLGRGKFPVSQERMVRAYETGDPDELSAMAQYNIEDSMLVLDLFLSQHVFDEAALEALTSETLIDDLYTKGMQIRALNKIYRYAKDEGYVVTTSPALSIARGQAQLVGALVQGSNPGRYDDVAVYDIRSMYPTLLMSRNVCYTTYLADVTDKSPEHHVYPWETKTGETEKSYEKHEAAFVTPTVRRGLCTRLLADQLILRDRIRSWGEGDILKYAQRGVKAVSNSIIGIMASSFESARLSFPAAAGVVYTAARSTITQIIQDVSQWEGAPHGQVVYSDTDSVLVAGMGDPQGRLALLRYLNDKYSPFIFELETVGRLLLVGPKNYIMRTNESGALMYKGVTFSRRNASDFVAKAMQDITEMIMDAGHSRTDILAYLKSRVDSVKEEPLDSFVMSATVSLAASSVGGKLGRRLTANGAILMPGDVVDYLVLTKPINEAKGCNVIELTKTGKVKKVKAAGVTDRTATVDELAACIGPETLSSPQIGVDFDYYVDKLRTSAEQLMVF